MTATKTDLQNVLFKPMIGITSYFVSAVFFFVGQSIWF